MIPIYIKWTILWTVIISYYAGAQNLDRKIIVNGVTREYILHVPSFIKTPNKIPLMLVFHGGGGSASNAISFFGMNNVADTAGFMIAYPNGLDNGWNDGRTIKNHTHDDVGFVRQLIRQVSKEYPIDSQRIFATGISNGGFFSFMLGLHLADEIKAIAPVCATIPQEIYDHYLPSHPINLLLINGTDDPLVPYHGGKVGGKWMSRGICMSTAATLARFVQFNKCSGNPTQTKYPNLDLNDGCTATRSIYSCAEGAQVQLIQIAGGGHSWPGGKQYLGKFIIGKVCRDFSASVEVWNFFRQF